jgi:CRP/FNR family cyclic AMP-dependent transcriptional regulator
MNAFNPADLFRHEAEFTRIAAGETLFQEGDAADFMYVLVKGEAQITVREYRVEQAQVGALIGEMAMIDRAPRSATVKALSDCTLVRLDQRRFDFLVTQTPYFARHVMQVMAQRLRKTDALLR